MLILIHSIFEHGLDSILGNSFSFHMQLLQSWLQRGPLAHTKSSPTAVSHISLHIFRYSKFTWTPLCFTISISSHLKVQQFFILYVYLFFNKNEKLTHVKILGHEIFSNYGVLLVHPIPSYHQRQVQSVWSCYQTRQVLGSDCMLPYTPPPCRWQQKSELRLS